MKTNLFYLIMIVVFCYSCKEKDSGKNLVQPDKWWEVHPRPVYAELEKVGTFQDWFDVYKLAEGTYAIYEPNQFEEAMSYLVTGDKRAILIDTGNGIGNIKSLCEKLTDLPVSVLLTHEHYDHVAGAYLFDEIAMFDNPQALAVLKKGRDHESLKGYLKDDYFWKPTPEDFDADNWIIPSMVPTELLYEGDKVDLGNRTLEVIYTPGHSPGEICLLDPKHRILFTGDHFFPGPLYAYSADVNIEDYINSTERLIGRIDEYDYLCSGHNDPWVKSEVLIRVNKAFDKIFGGGGKFDENDVGLRRYYFKGFDILITVEQIEDFNNK